MMKIKISLVIGSLFIFIIGTGGTSHRTSGTLFQQKPPHRRSISNVTNMQEQVLHTTQPPETMDESTTPLAPPIPETIALSPPQPTTIIPPWFDEITLFDAVVMGNLEAVKYRISIAGDDPTAENDGRGPSAPIQIAAGNGDLPILKYLVEEAGVSIHSTNRYGDSPLLSGVTGCKLNVIKYLVEKRADVNGVNYRAGDTVLSTAIRSNCVSGISYLLEQGAVDVNETDDWRGRSLLHLAIGEIFEIYIQTFGALLDGGVPLEARDKDGATPLHAAIIRDRSSINLVKYLIAKGADVKTIDDKGNSLLHTAEEKCKNQNQDGHEHEPSSCGPAGLARIKYLIESSGAGVELLNVTNKEGRTPFQSTPIGSPLGQTVLQSAWWRAYKNCSSEKKTSAAPPEYKYMDLAEAIRTGNVDAVRYRLSIAGENLSAVDSFSHTHAAVASGNLEMVKYFVEESGLADDVNRRSPAYPHMTPLHVSVRRLHFSPSFTDDRTRVMEIARYLVSRGANVSATDSDGVSVLHVAAQGAYLEPVQYLVEAGADVNAKDDSGRTPLHRAAEHNALHIAYYLVEHGAVVNAKDEYGFTPLFGLVGHGEGNPLPFIKYLVRSGAELDARILDRRIEARVRDFLRDAGLEVNVKKVDDESGGVQRRIA